MLFFTFSLWSSDVDVLWHFRTLPKTNSDNRNHHVCIGSRWYMLFVFRPMSNYYDLAYSVKTYTVYVQS